MKTNLTKSNPIKTKKQIKTIAVLLLSVIFNVVFWKENIGINYLIYTVPVVGFLIAMRPSCLKNTPTLITMGGTLLSMGALIFLHSTFSIVLFFISALLFVAFYHQNELKSIYYALASNFANVPMCFKGLFQKEGTSNKKPLLSQQTKKWLKLTVIPIIITFVFFLIYREANPIFFRYTENLLDEIGYFFENLFKDFSLMRFWFFGLGTWISAYFIFFHSQKKLSVLDQKQNNVIARIKFKYKYYLNPVALLNEYRTALITLILLNGLLLLVNTIDIWKVWFNFSYIEGIDLSGALHEGTYLLIFAILLSIGVIVYFFRGNINYFSKNKTLVKASYAWIIQNFVLAGTVAVKCFYYIHYQGLTYKRIGVLLFLLVVVSGLILMLVKIKHKKSIHFLLRTDSWIAYGIMVFACLVNWDGLIVKNNLKLDYPSHIDYRYLLDLADRTLPLIVEHYQQFEDNNHYKSVKYRHYQFPYETKLTNVLDKRIYKFRLEHEKNTPLSWNYDDYATYQALKSYTTNLYNQRGKQIINTTNH